MELKTSETPQPGFFTFRFQSVQLLKNVISAIATMPIRHRVNMHFQFNSLV